MGDNPAENPIENVLGLLPLDFGACSSHQVLEYHPQPWNQWVTVGNLQVERSGHAVLSVGPQQLSCLSSGGSFNGYDGNSGPSDLDRGSSL